MIKNVSRNINIDKLNEEMSAAESSGGLTYMVMSIETAKALRNAVGVCRYPFTGPNSVATYQGIPILFYDRLEFGDVDFIKS